MKQKYHLVKHFWIACAHRVPNAGKCDRIHGHNYKVTFCIEGSKLDDKGMLIDFRDVKHSIEDKYDHYLLNDFPEFDVDQGGSAPSTEKVAEVFYSIIKDLCLMKINQPKVKWVEVQETNEVFVRYSEELEN
ncbi:MULTISPECIES: 6-pyruvoyl trahydropterin synthase family protein [Aneurinibacillus]|uniref:6-carboxy-5,6,7,8-tetrahydropterin synthase n=1 Tax=Aneurinibacillus thermoaerophilus TaxID=143495 RepID=A0ABX8YEJ0_ANETH|nr:MULTISPECIES: 6-carboxytetrahydropterin synthase [Aneurinibacillus]AMA73383.1 6-pyruvoyl tetrahydrobiopterin synthase [Aneurinibacillus sp. XH2]MED0676044.1 6-carboxytetrahydropterin synthase [Aneurinibacillus thermoaerophilus]MED0681101.1 6-carboxytetrahydropterin synthase [Aneurinibacillus thermoaerophilus]MED0736327.1 6-carboxytetrahydropterin synthase [Aneurinibacillus thermoaerophilus]MED0766228.1 6-carboxytetrahydropterin synthase [Aneurinibacillus thermoaerophilus]